jgi:low affinity Fe/Cu permease
MRVRKGLHNAALDRTRRTAAPDDVAVNFGDFLAHDGPARPPAFDEDTIHEYQDEMATPRRSIKKRTSQLPVMSKLLYRIDFYSSLPIVSVSVVGAIAVMLVVGVAIGFPRAWVTTFEVTVSSVTLLMVFTIQHTQGREQAATQRKLDELLRATPGAAEALMMLEEAPREFMLEVEDSQRVVRSGLVDEMDTNDSGDVSYQPKKG